MSDQTILAIEGGGSGYRAAKVTGKQIELIGGLSATEIAPDSVPAFINDCAGRIGAQAVGVSTSGFVTPDGAIEHSTNIGLPDNYRLAALTAAKTGLPTKVVNDLVAATRGISVIFPLLPRFLVENLGDGDGQNEFDQGRIKPIDERGHMPVDISPLALPCACGLYGCAESILGGRSLERRVNLTIDALRLNKPENLHACAFLDQEYRAGADWAVRIYDQFAFALGFKLSGMQLGGKFPAIVFRGTTIIKALSLNGMEEKIRNAMRRFLPVKSWADAEFLAVPPDPRGIKDYDGFLGAAAFARDLL